jgi:hypothetical protein
VRGGISSVNVYALADPGPLQLTGSVT